MNILLVGITALCVVCMIIGYKRGFIKIVISLIATIATLVLVGMFTPQVVDVLCKYTPLDDSMQTKFTTMLMGNEFERGEVEEEEEIQPEIPLSEQLSIIEDAELPEFMKAALVENNNGEIYEQLEVEYFAEYAGKFLANWVIRVLAFIITFLVVWIVIRVFVFSLDVIAELPVLHGINRGIGTVLGLGFALIFVWIGFLWLSIAYSSEIGQMCHEWVQESRILTYLYEHNPISQMLMK